MTETRTRAERAYDSVRRLADDPDERIDSLRELPPADDDVRRQEAVFKALANEDRLRLLAALRECECCVCELQVVLDAPQSTVGTHLQKLRDAGLITSRKKGKWRYYRIADTAVFELLDVGHAVGDSA